MFDFGNKQARTNPVVADVASGIPCGVASRRGALHLKGFNGLNIITTILYLYLEKPALQQQPPAA